MLFNSLSFAIFFPIVTVVYFLLPHRSRWAWLLMASCYFYMAFRPIYILILAFTILIDYVAGRLIASARGVSRRALLILSLIANIGVLGVFKYFDFFASITAHLGTWMGMAPPLRPLGLLLPIGLSFHTFQSMSYTIEVYRGRQKAEHRLGIFALYVMFYPQLVAGPIERPQNLLHQFDEPHRWSWPRAYEGLLLMGWGLFKKMAIADAFAPFVNTAYHNPSGFGGGVLLFATLLFAFQIYCDFSGYSDIAIGSARVMGFRLMSNFNRPYASRSIAEFWQRWHISLSTWFKDYVYIPLGGNRVSTGRWCRNIFITFLLSGLWHGANITFVVWGALNGFYLVIARAAHGWAEGLWSWLGSRASRILGTTITFIAITISWIFFRAASLSDALLILRRIFIGPWGGTLKDSMRTLLTTNPPWLLAEGLLSLAVMELIHWRRSHAQLHHETRATAPSIRPSWIGAAVVFCLLTLLVGVLLTGERPHSAFIYFQF